MTFKVSNPGSKRQRPHLNRAYVLGVFDNLGTTVKKNHQKSELLPMSAEASFHRDLCQCQQRFSGIELPTAN